MTFMNNDWIQNLKKKVNRNGEKELTVVGPYDHDDLSCAEIAARAGVSHITVRVWLCKKIIPTPRNKNGPKPMRMRKWPNRHHFSRQYAEGLRDCVIMRKSSKNYSSMKAFRDLCFSMLRKCF
jgi:hypothetical protein